MRTYTKNGLPIFSPPSSNCSDPVSPTLQDSKSTSNLYQNTPECKKFRQTTYFPATTKNTNRQFLRYTVNLNKSQKQALVLHVSPAQRFRVQRKLTIQQGQKKSNGIQDSHNLAVKPSSAQKKVQRKGSNPQKKQKQQLGAKVFAIPKFLEKKYTMQNLNQDNANKTERIPTQPMVMGCPSPDKKTFTPKLNKTNQSKGQANKIITCYSSSDLLKLNNLSSPTCESLTSRIVQKQVPPCGPSFEDFKKIKFLGQGKFGQVHLVCHLKTNTLYAMKQIKKDTIIKNKMQQQLMIEIKMQFYLNHPNILKLYGVFKDQQNIYLILEYMEQGTLYSALKKKKVFKQSDASKKLRDVLDGVYHLHKQNIAHRDIKPQNIVVSNDVCKICDLGWAAICDDRRKTLCGTIDYASPQLLQGKQYGIAIDLWCLGVLCYQLMVGKCPFYHISRKQTMKKIINADLSDINLPSTLPIQTKDFICKLLLKNPEERMSAQSALVHPLIIKYQDQDLEDLRSGQKRK